MHPPHAFLVSVPLLAIARHASESPTVCDSFQLAKRHRRTASSVSPATTMNALCKFAALALVLVVMPQEVAAKRGDVKDTAVRLHVI